MGQRLRDAENIIVIGFSMPSTDEFFRYLYALGTTGGPVLQRFWVVDPDPSGIVEGRFKALLGPGAEARFRAIKKDFAGVLDDLRNEFRIDTRSLILNRR